MMSTHKGLDDLVAAGLRPRRLAGGDVSTFFARVRARLFGSAPADAAQTPAPAPERTQAVAERPRPTFPIDVFPEKVAAFARRVAAAMRCPIDFIGLAVLVVSGSAVGAARSLKAKGGWYEKAMLYAGIVSRPGTTKTAALKAVMQPVFQEQDRLYEDHKAAQKKFEQDLEGYKEAKRNPRDDQPGPVLPESPSPMRHVFVNDTTIESLAANLAENRKGLLLFRDELTAWVRSLDMYKGRGTDRQFFLSAWTGEMVKVDRKQAQGKSIIIPHPFVSVLGGIQPDLLTEREAEGGKEDGFLHRILFAYPAETEAAIWSEEEISEEDELEWQLVLGRLFNLQPVRPEGGSERPKALHFSEDGKQAWIAVHDGIVAEMNAPDSPPELFGPWSKLKAHCLRFALILHLLRVACDEAGDCQSEGQVDAEDVRRAAQLCEYFKRHLELVYPRLRQSREDKSVDDLVAWMRRKHLQRVTLRDICRANVCGIKTSSDAEKLLQAAIDRGLGEADGGDNRQRRRRGPEIQAFLLKGDP
jgi:hypothetical protein